MIKPLFALLLFSFTVLPHDFFISVLTVHHNAEEQSLDLTWQITAHDLEHALSNVADLKLNSDKDSETVIPLIDTLAIFAHICERLAKAVWASESGVALLRVTLFLSKRCLRLVA